MQQESQTTRMTPPITMITMHAIIPPVIPSTVTSNCTLVPGGADVVASSLILPSKLVQLKTSALKYISLFANFHF